MRSILRHKLPLLFVFVWAFLLSDDAQAEEFNCGLNRDSVCVANMVPEVDLERAWTLLMDDLKYAFVFFRCLHGEQLSCAQVGGEFTAGRNLTYNLELSASLVAKPCDEGIDFACLLVGQYLMETYADPADKGLIAELFHRSCQMDAKFCQPEAELYMGGGFFDEDLKKAASVLIDGCTRQSGESCYLFALMVGDESSPEYDFSLTIEFLAWSCTFGLAEGCFDMGAQLFEKVSLMGEGIDVREYFEKSCKLGLGSGCHVLGLLAGPDAPFFFRDYDEELAWQEKGCSLDDPDSCARAGYLYDSDLVSYPDPVMSATYSERGCELGEPVACANIGLKYEFGTGVVQDGKKAFDAYEFACNNGNGGGCNGLGNVYAKGMAGEQDDFRAVEMFEKSCELGDPIGCTNVAYFAEEQRGVFRMDAQIREYYQRGCDGGFAEACRMLKKFDAR